MDSTTSTSDGQRRERRQVSFGALIASVVATAVIAGGVAGVAVAGVTPTFPDVPPGHRFFDEIEWMASTGVSEGFPDGTYKPNEPVSRGSMSAFMQRLFDVQDDLAVAGTTSPTETTGTGFTTVPGATAEVQVPPGTAGYIVARFSGESACYGNPGWCTVRLMIDDNGDGTFEEMSPAAGTNFAFDSTDNASEGANSWESHATERWKTVSRGCTCQVRAEYRVNTAGITFLLDDYSLVVETDLLPSDESFGP